jgi:hypothetical protein
MTLPARVACDFRYGPLAARAKASQPGYHAWVLIDRRAMSYRIYEDPSKKIIIRWVESSDENLQEAKRLEGEVDYRFATNHEEILVTDENGIAEVVTRWLENLDDLKRMRQTDYPF